MQYIELFLRVTAPILSFVFIFATAQQGRYIWKEKSVNKSTPLPFASLLLSSFMWTIYGVLVKDVVILAINISSTLVSLFCVGVYSIFVKNFPWQMYAICTAVILLGIHFAFDNDIFKIGIIGCVLTVLSSLTPLATIGTVLKDKSTASMPSFTMTLASFITNVVWSLYGVLVTNDPLIYIPSAICLFPIGVQLVVYGIYPTSSTSY